MWQSPQRTPLRILEIYWTAYLPPVDIKLEIWFISDQNEWKHCKKHIKQIIIHLPGVLIVFTLLDLVRYACLLVRVTLWSFTYRIKDVIQSLIDHNQKFASIYRESIRKYHQHSPFFRSTQINSATINLSTNDLFDS
jgi:hypothetical protein